jgi:hypothetical protein
VALNFGLSGWRIGGLRAPFGTAFDFELGGRTDALGAIITELERW